MRTTSWWEFSAAIAVEDVRERLFRKPVCGSWQFAPIMQRSYAKPITFRPSSENRSLVHNLRGTKARWRLLRIIIMVVQQRTRLTGLTRRTAFLYGMLYLI